MRAPISKAIDPKRVGISKSTIVATSLCARKGWFGEHVRDAEGRRLSIPMPERVLFGTAIDEAIQNVLWNLREGREPDQEEAVAEGLGAMASRPGAEDLDPIAIEAELALAVALFMDGEMIGSIFGDTQPEHWRFQGEDGESLRAGEFIGTPDILIHGPRPAIWDVKSSPRSKAARDLWSPEMAHYAALYAELYGRLPQLGYATWVRTKSPRWQAIAMDASPLHISLADAHRSATKAALSASVSSLPFSTSLCGSCEWKAARPELEFGGCSIGQAVEEMGMTEKEGTHE